MILLLDILAGFFLGICYDIFKAFRKKTQRPVLGVCFDLLFWTVSLLLSIWLFLLIGDRKFRVYEVFGMSTGFLFYFLMISKYFVKISEKIADFFLFFLKILFTILNFFAIMSKNGVLFLWNPLKHLIRFTKKTTASGFQKMKRNRKLIKRI